MRNRFAGTCYRCNQRVEPGGGHFERHKGGWRTQHAECAIAYRRQATAVNVQRPASLAEARQMETRNAPSP
jgi:hypothetical protein